jgi:hypothetical protein
LALPCHTVNPQGHRAKRESHCVRSFQ